jgi:hypothetical protein
MKINMHSNHEELIKKLNIVENKLDAIEPNNAVRNIEIYNEINSITEDVRFIKHKIHEIEEGKIEGKIEFARNLFKMIINKKYIGRPGLSRDNSL